MSLPRVLIIGDSTSITERIANDVLSLAAHSVVGAAIPHSAAAPSAPSLLSASENDSLNSLLFLSTKYYTATVEFIILPMSAYTNPESYEWTNSVGIEAVILILDASIPLVLLNATTWADRVADVPTLLAVATRADLLPDRSRATALKVFNDWALDSGFELVTVSSTPDISLNLSESSDPRDKVGVPRILEALESTMWSNLVRVDARMDASPAAIALVAASEGATATAFINGHTDAYQPPLLQSTPASKSTPKDTIASTTTTSTTTTSSLLEPKIDKEFDFADFGALLDEARIIRDLARSGTVNDDARRTAAASVAQKLLAMLAQGGGDEDEDEEDEVAGTKA